MNNNMPDFMSQFISNTSTAQTYGDEDKLRYTGE